MHRAQRKTQVGAVKDVVAVEDGAGLMAILLASSN
jgi:hypothetical protein